jgi:hypothetical protein
MVRGTPLLAASPTSKCSQALALSLSLPELPKSKSPLLAVVVVVVVLAHQQMGQAVVVVVVARLKSFLALHRAALSLLLLVQAVLVEERMLADQQETHPLLVHTVLQQAAQAG